MKPLGAMVRIEPNWYKIGRHGMVFFYNNKEWVRSEKTASEIERAIRKEEEKKNAV